MKAFKSSFTEQLQPNLRLLWLELFLHLAAALSAIRFWEASRQVDQVDQVTCNVNAGAAGAEDVSNPLKPFNLSKAWAMRVLDEFFQQGDAWQILAAVGKRGSQPTVSPAVGAP